MNLNALTIPQLKRVVAIREHLAALEAELNNILGGKAGNAPIVGIPKRNMSSAGRARIAAAQRARWAKFKAQKKALAKVGGKPTKAK